jgi:hypothetical protein
VTISPKTRKLLWGNAGRLCAICKASLVEPGNQLDAHAIVGDEAHIRGQKAGAARYDVSLPKKQIDAYENLLLLCRTHHKMVDDQPNTYSVEVLQLIKLEHEIEVEQALRAVGAAEHTHELMTVPRLTTGYEVMRMIFNAHCYYKHHDSPPDAAAAQAIAVYLELVEDWGEISTDVGEAQLLLHADGVTEALHELDRHQFAAYGMQLNRTVEHAGQRLPQKWPVVLSFVVDVSKSEQPPPVVLSAIPKVIEI